MILTVISAICQWESLVSKTRNQILVAIMFASDAAAFTVTGNLIERVRGNSTSERAAFGLLIASVVVRAATGASILSRKFVYETVDAYWEE